MIRKASSSPTRDILCIIRSTLAIAAVVYLLIAQSASAQQPQPNRQGSPNDFRKDSKRGPDNDPRTNAADPGKVKMGLRTIVSPKEFRTIDGSDNNLINGEWGRAEVPFLRTVTADYADGTNAPSGGDRPNARAVSNAVSAQEELMPSRRLVSDFLWQWGQFLDHDITLTPTAEPVETFNVAVPAGDPFFDPQGTGVVEISLDRSFHEDVNGVREQINEITAYIDASNVYGSDSERALELRANDGSGRLLTSAGDLLPFNVNGFPNAPTANAPNFFLAGDFRANEQVGLTAMHTLFVREHNYWADAIAKSNADLTGDQIYEVARAIVGAEMQVITYNEFLPLLLGPKALPRYSGYLDTVDAGITNVFATASYRFGHSMLSSTLMRLDRRGREIDEGHLDLASAFFNPSVVINEGGIEPLLRGLARQTAQEIDIFVVDDVRNFLFGPPGAGGFDLATLNIQRGRDHGLAGYNEVRKAFGLRPARRFSDITPDRRMQEKLASVYSDVEQIDAWVGGLAEPPVRGALVGETNFAVLRDQFLRLRDGDRFWYQRQLDKELQRLVEGQTLSKIIQRNTDIGRELQDNVFISKGEIVLDDPSSTQVPGRPVPGRGNDRSRPRFKGR